MRRGMTVVELSVVLLIAGILFGVTVPRALTLRDRLAVRGATHEVSALFAIARHWAIRHGRLVVVRVDTSLTRMYVSSGRDTLARRTLRADYGVSIATTRDSVRYGPSGRGYGAANTSIFITRGSAADTVVVSRLGRVRH